MATMRHQADVPQLVDDGSSHLLLEVGRTIRDGFPVLCGLSLLLMVGAIPWLVLATTFGWLVAWGPLVLCTAPLWVGALAVAERMLRGDVVRWRQVPGEVRRQAMGAWQLALVPAISGAGLLLLLAAAADESEAGLMTRLAVPWAGVCLAVMLLLGPAGVLVMRTSLRGVALWRGAAAVLVVRPLRVIGTAVLCGMAVVLAVFLGPALLLALAPLAVLWVAVLQPEEAGTG